MVEKPTHMWGNPSIVRRRRGLAALLPCPAGRFGYLRSVNMCLVPDLLDKRLVIVTGKGGVGKSTVALAMGLAAAA